MGGACACARIQHFGAKMRFKRESDGEYIIIKQPMTVLSGGLFNKLPDASRFIV